MAGCLRFLTLYGAFLVKRKVAPRSSIRLLDLARPLPCIFGMPTPFCLAALSGQSPQPAGARRQARGIDGESACRAIMRHAKNGLAAKFTIFIFTRPFGVVSPVSVTSRVQRHWHRRRNPRRSPLSGADRATALYSVDPLRIVP